MVCESSRAIDTLATSIHLIGSIVSLLVAVIVTAVTTDRLLGPDAAVGAAASAQHRRSAACWSAWSSSSWSS